MIPSRWRLAPLLVALFSGVAGCASAAPTAAPSMAMEASASVLASPSPTRSGGQPTAATPSPTNRHGTLELDIGALDTAWTAPMLEFASDGESIIFSSGVADGPGADTAPDLWRFLPGRDAPELVWSNPNRDRQLVRLGGDLGTWAFVEIGIDGARDWDLYLLTGAGSEPIHLDTHPGDEDVSSLVPSFAVHQDRIVWTAFDRGPEGPVSQLLSAQGPDWQPAVLLERDASRSELWLPSLRGSLLAFCEVVYSADQSTDERHVYVMDVAETNTEPRRLDSSGLATMPLLTDGGVIWKEADRGFNMFNWGRLFRFDAATAETSRVTMRPQDYVNYPSAGSRFIAAWGADAFTFTIHDLELDRSRIIALYEPETNESVMRPHISGDLLVWLYSTQDGLGNGPPGEIRYAFLPGAGSNRVD